MALVLLVVLHVAPSLVHLFLSPIFESVHEPPGFVVSVNPLFALAPGP